MTSGPYRSFKEIRSNRERVVFVDAVHRLYWTLSGTFPSSISVMTNRRGGLEPREPLSKADGTWHEIASLSITEPKVSSIEVSIDNFRDWEYEWVIRHQEHAGAEFVTYGDLDDETRPYASEQYEDGSWESDSDKEFLIRCCGQDRPIRKNELKLLVEPSPGEDYVTIQSYITVVHPWLMSLRENILLSTHIWDNGPALDTTTEWMVSMMIAPSHVIEPKKNWIRRHSPLPAVPSPAVQRIMAMRAEERRRAQEKQEQEQQQQQ